MLVSAGGTFRVVFDSDENGPGEFVRDLQVVMISRTLNTAEMSSAGPG